MDPAACPASHAYDADCLVWHAHDMQPWTKLPLQPVGKLPKLELPRLNCCRLRLLVWHAHDVQPWTELPFQPVMPNLEVPRPPMFERSLLPDLKSLSTLDAVVSPKPVSCLWERMLTLAGGVGALRYSRVWMLSGCFQS
eukprot:1156503-Pelagomonas_calceolata.AAC.5